MIQVPYMGNDVLGVLLNFYNLRKAGYQINFYNLRQVGYEILESFLRLLTKKTGKKKCYLDWLPDFRELLNAVN